MKSSHNNDTGLPNEHLQAQPIQQTTTVFNRPQLVFDEHQWLQQGYSVMDVCNPPRPECHHVVIPIPPGKLLIKGKDGKHRLEDETDTSIPERQHPRRQQRPAKTQD